MYQIILDSLKSGSTIDPTAFAAMPAQYESNVVQTIDEINHLQEDECLLTPVFPTIEIPLVDDAENLCIEDSREKFHSEQIFHETDIFTSLINTMSTMDGYSTNVNFHEKDLITKVVCNSDIVVAVCNFGKVVYEGYTEPAPKVKTNRGRKKKEKPKKNRKKQGDGTCFNSQLSFHVRSRNVELVDGWIVPSDAPVYKFKLFRTGKIQLPGSKSATVFDVMECLKIVIEYVDLLLHGEAIPGRNQTVLTSAKQNLKNYKWRIKMRADHIVNLVAFDELISREMARHRADRGNIFIHDKTYSTQSTKFSFRFHTPLIGKPEKMLRVNVEQSGKMGILAALESGTTCAIVEYLHALFENNWDELIVQNGDYLPMWTPREDNIESVENESELIARLHHPFMPIINIDPDITATVMSMINV